MTDAGPDATADLPNRARIWNYWLGGKDHYAADRHNADAISASLPGAPHLVRATLQFGERVVRQLAREEGIRQFLDVGSGLPVDRDLRAALRDVAPDATVVHLDHDPFVLMRATALPARDGQAGVSVYRAADFRDPSAVLSAAGTVLDLAKPVAVLFTGVLGYVRSPGRAAHIVHEVLAGLVPGSFLVIWDLVAGRGADESALDRRHAITGGYDLGSAGELEKLFAGLEMIGPGVVPVTEWLPSDEDTRWDGTGGPIDAYGGVARLPADWVPTHAPEPVHEPETPAGRTTSTWSFGALDGRPPPPVQVRSDVPAPARVWNYWLGGKDHFAVDRAVGDAVIADYPLLRDLVLASREFLVRTVRHLAESGVRQFLDIGSGLPAGRNTHEIAQSVRPDARVVYVDNDPQVLIHSRARLGSAAAGGAVTYVEADYRDPDTLVARAAATLDLEEPVAAMFMGVLGHADVPAMHRAVHSVVAALPAGSHLVLWDSTDTSAAVREAAVTQTVMGVPYRLSSLADLQECFAGLELLEPGLVRITEWWPDAADGGPGWPMDAFGGVGRKP
ncbi:SAM-dependent methyltransferase [Pseudonocardia sp. CA-107938]|uniref:SAM-dependent methyltransferase n=1 Tax=Pseudonocardia sp. CA-107938 TaxID=3240021 RepID=UPI003D8C0910